MKNTLCIDLAHILEERYPHGFNAPVTIDTDVLIEFGDENWTHDLDITEHLAESRRIGLIYSTEDVKQVRPDLNDDQAWDVLQQFEAACEDCPDPLFETMQQLADTAYPPDSKQLLTARLDRIRQRIERLPRHEPDNPAGYGEAAALLDAVESELNRQP